ncbi:MAG: hypothetical protein AAF329_24475, partial [Cyanobacteria bacterium P01_A01_bin.17]
MLRSTLIASLMLSSLAGAAFEARAIESDVKAASVSLGRLQEVVLPVETDGAELIVASVLYAQATPRTVQVERGGAQIYTQPESNSQVIGEYRAGVVLSPRLRLFNPEGQAWLRVGDHWIAEESVMVLEGETAAAASSKRPTPIDLPTPASAAALPTVTPQQSGGAQQPMPTAPSPQPAAAPVTAEPKPVVKPQPKPQPAAAKPKPQAKPQPKATAKSSGPRKAVLITKDPKAQVNVRTANNLQSDVIHA